jgi:hypothetical protein
LFLNISVVKRPVSERKSLNFVRSLYEAISAEGWLV